MLKRLLFATVGLAAFTAALPFPALAADGQARYVFRGNSGLLNVATGGDHETEIPVDPGSPEEPGESDPDPEEPTDPEDEDSGDDDAGDSGEEPGETEPVMGDPVSGLSIGAVLALDDTNGNGYGDRGEMVRLRTVVHNVSGAEIQGIKVAYRIELPGWYGRAGFFSIAMLAPGESMQLAADPAGLTEEMMAVLATGTSFQATVSLIEAGGETWPFDENAQAATLVPFGTYDPVKPEEITLSNLTAVHLDTDGDGYGDRGEIIRVSFTVGNTGRLPAQGISYEITFPEWPSATAYCDRASLSARASMSCTADIELTRADLDDFGAPETVVSLNGIVSLVALNGDYYASGEHATALSEITFKVPPIEYAPHLRIVASEGWVFQCVTPWEASFVSENQEMFLTRWDTGKRAIVPAGGKTAVGKTFNLHSAWIQIGNINPQTRQANAGKRTYKPIGDPQPAFPSSMPPPCGPNGKFTIVSHGDLTTAYDVIFESVEVVNLPI